MFETYLRVRKKKLTQKELETSSHLQYKHILYFIILKLYGGNISDEVKRVA